MSSTLFETLQSHLVTALKGHDAERASCVRQIKAKLQETMNAPGFTGKPTDDVVLQVIGSYVKSLEKSIVELRAAGDKGLELVGKYESEIAYLRQFLPTLLDGPATRALVEKALATLGISDPKQAGRAMGAILKDNKGKLDTQLLKNTLNALLGA
jgi:uncharacterized protein YqeY